MKFILLEDWARKNGIKPMDAKNWARRKKLKCAKQKLFSVMRWVIEEDYKIE